MVNSFDTLSSEMHNIFHHGLLRQGAQDSQDLVPFATDLEYIISYQLN